MGKPEGRHPDKRLSDAKVRNEKNPGRFSDGGGLYLVVEPSGAKRWLLRISVKGHKRMDIGLGSTEVVSLKEAREEALAMRKLARQGIDPAAQRRKDRETVPTFAEAAQTTFELRRKAWKNEKHAAQWIGTLEQYAVPLIGSRPINRLATADMLRVLSPIWHEKPETARRVLQRLRAVFDWAKSAGHYEGENPTAMVRQGLGAQAAKKDHHTALPFPELPGFIADLREAEAAEIVRLALEFTILTVARTGETILAQWAEVDEGEAIWTVPAERMKAGKEHRVPMGERAMEILARAKVLGGGSPYIFPGRSPARPLSNMAMLMLLRRIGMKAGGKAVTVHGFRSSFRDWAAERTVHQSEVIEMALAHAIPDRVERAYRRGDLFEKRRRLMDDWERFATLQPGKVVPLDGVRA